MQINAVKVGTFVRSVNMNISLANDSDTETKSGNVRTTSTQFTYANTIGHQNVTKKRQSGM